MKPGKPFFGERHLQLAREQGAPDPEFNADLSNRINDLVLAGSFDAAEALILRLTDCEMADAMRDLLYCYREGE